MSTTAGHWTVVREVISSTDTGAQVMGALPGLVRRLLDEKAWMEFTTPDGHHVEYSNFTEFVTASPPRGLGGRIPQLVALCGTDEKLARTVKRLAREAIPAANRPGNPHGKECGTSINTGVAEHVVRRLKRDDPELAEQVVSGEITPNAAAQAKGWRKPRVLLTSPESVARKLREHFTADQLAELIRFLIGGDDP